ncbi:hypothetical protein GCM10027414_24250 [Humibacter ginsengiterrae]
MTFVIGACLTPVAANATGIASADPRPVPGAVADAASAGSESDASAIARAHNHSVVVDSETTPTSQISALPNGSFQYEADSVPVRVKQNGTWGKIDTALTQLSDGLWAPTASAAQVRFGSGGSNVLDKVQTVGGDWITETWPYGNLPTPSVSGSTATFADVLPGVDVRLTATASGMSDVLVIESATAATNPKLQSLNLPVSGATMAAGTADTAKARATDGSAVVSASPLWWDSSDGSSAKGPHGDAPVRPLQHSTDAHGVTMNIASTITASKPTYPVFVDPDWSTGANAYWFTDAAYPNQSYLNGNYADGIQAVGINAPYQSDMFWQFPMGAIAGKYIENAVVNTTQVWAGTCSLTPIDVHVYGPQGPGFTWNQEQSWSGQWGGILQSQNPTAGCPGQAAGAVGWSVTSGVASYAAASRSTIQFAWTYDNPNSNYSRRHYSQSASLIVTYDSAPNTPTSPVFSSPPRACGTSTSPVKVNGNDPVTFQVNESDPDGGNVGVDFFYGQATSGNGAPTSTTKYTTPLQAAGAIRYAAPAGSFTDGNTYAWYARGTDYTLVSANTAWCYFTVDNSQPSAPSMPTGPITGLTVGTGTTLQIGATGPAADTAEFEVWVAPGTDQSTVPVVIGSGALPTCGSAQGGAQFVCPSNGTATVTVAAVDQTSTAWAVAVDGAGNESALAGVELQAAEADTALTGAHGWQLEKYPPSTYSALPATINDDNQTAGTDLNAAKNVTIGQGLSLTAQDTVPPASSASYVYSFNGLVWLDREFNGTYHVSDTGGTIQSGYTVEKELGQLLPTTTGGTSPLGATTAIYSCAFSNKTNMTSSNASCEGTGATPTLIGYSFNSQPSGVPSVQLYRCTNGNDRITTTSTTCEAWNKTPDGSLGWFLNTGNVATGTTTTGQAIDTTKSFTVSAWVKPVQDANSPKYRTIMSEAGPTRAGFVLQQNTTFGPNTGGELSFCVNSQLSGATNSCATASSGAVDGQWLFVTGIYDSVNQQVRLLIGDIIKPVAIGSHQPVSGQVSASGAVMIGNSVTNGKVCDGWGGEIADPVVLPFVIDTNQLDNIYYETPVA